MTNKIEHFKGENESWQRTLSFLVEESLYLKNRLSDIAKADISPEMLDELEYFQNTFLNKETALSIMQNDIVDQLGLLTEPKAHDGELFDRISQQQEKLRKDMAAMHKEFIDIRVRFNKTMIDKL